MRLLMDIETGEIYLNFQVYAAVNYLDRYSDLIKYEYIGEALGLEDGNIKLFNSKVLEKFEVIGLV